MTERLPRRTSSLNSGAFRFALAFAGIFAVAAFLLLGSVRHEIGRYAHKATVGALSTEAAILVAEDRGRRIEAIDRRMRAAPGNFQYLLLDPAGRTLIGDIPAAAAHVGWGEVMMHEHPPTLADNDKPERLVTLGTRLTDGSLLVVATDGYDIDTVRHHMVRFTIGWALAITLLALLGGWWVGRLFLMRLGAVNAAVDRIMTGRLDQRLPTIGIAPELDELSHNLNRMLDRIDGLMEGLRQVTTDVAHDLRTPLTRLRQMLEAARDASTRDELEAGIDVAMAQADHLLATFRAILRLAQIEGGGRRAPFERVDLRALVETLIETYDPVAADAGHLLSATVAEAATVTGDAELLAQLIANLIENAILHTPEGTQVAIDVTRGENSISVTLADDGPGVPPAERERITRRFYQVDPSRSRGSTGLGLSIVNAIVNLHGAALAIEDAQPGLRVTVTFPQA